MSKTDDNEKWKKDFLDLCKQITIPCKAFSFATEAELSKLPSLKGVFDDECRMYVNYPTCETNFFLSQKFKISPIMSLNAFKKYFKRGLVDPLSTFGTEKYPAETVFPALKIKQPPNICPFILNTVWKIIINRIEGRNFEKVLHKQCLAEGIVCSYWSPQSKRALPSTDTFKPDICYIKMNKPGEKEVHPNPLEVQYFKAVKIQLVGEPRPFSWS